MREVEVVLAPSTVFFCTVAGGGESCHGQPVPWWAGYHARNSLPFPSVLEGEYV